MGGGRVGGEVQVGSMIDLKSYKSEAAIKFTCVCISQETELLEKTQASKIIRTSN